MRNLMKLKVSIVPILFIQCYVYAQTITIGPYLQKATPNSILVRWYTDIDVDSEVKYGLTLGSLTQKVTVMGTRKNHTVELPGLSSNTKYYYSVGTSAGIIQSGSDNYFFSLPGPTDKGKYTFWITGDVGSTTTSNQASVLNAYNFYKGNNVTNGWILLGDNAYGDGQDEAFNSYFFQVYQGSIMKMAPLWPATGNHEYDDNLTLQRSHGIAYFRYFDPPTNGEAGGYPSGSEAYYSFDYGNIHFIALDSYIIEQIDGIDHRLFDDDEQSPQVIWLKQDLAMNDKEWTIVYFHHPPYTKGSHDSDNLAEYGLVEMRQNIVPILEQYDVDLVLSGHSHSYERSRLMTGHLGLSSSFVKDTYQLNQPNGFYNGSGDNCMFLKDTPLSSSRIGTTLYAVVGSSGRKDNPKSIPEFPHLAMAYGRYDVRGSLILDIEENRLDAKWLNANGIVDDQFTIMKNVNKTNNISLTEGQSVTLDASWVGQYNWSNSLGSTRSVSFTPTSSGIYTVTDQYDCIMDVFNITVSPLPVELVNFTARVDDEKVTLNWRTATELNNDYFEIQRFVNPEEIKTITKIPGHGTTNETHDYEFIDVWPVNGMAYYRLKQVDFNGKFEYSNVMRVNYDGTRSVQVFPNPGDGSTFKLSLGLDEGPLSITIMESAGRIITSPFTHTSSATNQMEIQFDSRLPAGMYFVQIKNIAGVTTRKWIVK